MLITIDNPEFLVMGSYTTKRKDSTSSQSQRDWKGRGQVRFDFKEIDGFYVWVVLVNKKEWFYIGVDSSGEIVNLRFVLINVQLGRNGELS